MPKLKNAFEIFHLLEKSNYRRCGEKTCSGIDSVFNLNTGLTRVFAKMSLRDG